MKFGWLPFCLEWGPSSRPYLRSIRNFCRHASRYTIGLLIFVGDCSLSKSNPLYNTMLNYSINIFEGFQNPNVTVDSFTLINTNIQNEFPFILLSILELGHIHIYKFLSSPLHCMFGKKSNPHILPQQQ